MTGFTTGMKSSLTDEWATPSYLFDELDEEFHFTLDVCAGEDNHKTPEYFDRETDGLAQEWKGTCWMNPPYGRTIGAWVKKAYEAARGGPWLSAYCQQERTQDGGGITSCVRLN